MTMKAMVKTRMKEKFKKPLPLSIEPYDEGSKFRIL